MKFLKKIISKVRGDIILEDYIKCGTKIGTGFWMGDKCQFDWSFPQLIKIGNNVTLSHNVDIICHDASLQKHLGVTKLGTVEIGDNVFVGAHTILLPGTVIGRNSIIAAGSVVSSRIPSGEIWGGVPAIKICGIDEFIQKHKFNYTAIDASNTFHSNINIAIDTKRRIDELITRYGKAYIK